MGALCARAAVLGAYLNVKINAADLKDETFKTTILKKAEKIANETIEKEQEILKIVNGKIGG